MHWPQLVHSQWSHTNHNMDPWGHASCIGHSSCTHSGATPTITWTPGGIPHALATSRALTVEPHPSHGGGGGGPLGAYLVHWPHPVHSQWSHTHHTGGGGGGGGPLGAYLVHWPHPVHSQWSHTHHTGGPLGAYLVHWPHPVHSQWSHTHHTGCLWGHTSCIDHTQCTHRCWTPSRTPSRTTPVLDLGHHRLDGVSDLNAVSGLENKLPLTSAAPSK